MRHLNPKAASRIASGGELSRLVLALRLAAGVEDATVIAFDEIDAGTGGETALAMGRKLADLSKGKQVFCVTHLPPGRSVRRPALCGAAGRGRLPQ